MARTSLSERAVDLTAATARRRAARLRQRAFFIAQCSVAAAVAYLVAKDVFRVAVPLFAPVAAIVALGMTHGQRLRRALEITVGVAVGVGIGELFVHAFGIGWWQIIVIVATSMTLAALLDQGTLIVNQAGIQGMIVALLVGGTHMAEATALGRWFEALIGSVVALVFASIVPTSTLLKPRAQATRLLDHLALMLAAIGDALTNDDVEAAERVLAEARDTERDLVTLRGYASDSADVVRVSPFHRGRRGDIGEITDILEPMDRAIRNARVLIRRATVSLQVGEPVPPRYVSAVHDLATAVDVLADELSAGSTYEEAEARLLAIGSATADPAPETTLSAEVIRAQIRSMAVDLLMVIGLESEEARDTIHGPIDSGHGPHFVTEIELGRTHD